MKAIPIIICAIVMTLTHGAMAQDQFRIGEDTVVWTVNQLHDVSSDTTEVYNCRFIQYGKTKIEWVQKGNYTMTFDIVSAKGSWKNSTGKGEVDYAVKSSDLKGALVFVRDEAGTRVNIRFEKSGSPATSYSFNVSSVNRK